MQYLMLVFGIAVALLLKDFLPGYAHKKGETLATKEDPAEFTRIAESIKTEHQLLIEQTRQPLLAGHSLIVLGSY